MIADHADADWASRVLLLASRIADFEVGGEGLPRGLTVGGAYGKVRTTVPVGLTA